MISFKAISRRRVAINKRDTHALNASDRLILKELERNITFWLIILRKVRGNAKLTEILNAAVNVGYIEMLKLITIETPLKKPRMRHTPMNFQTFWQWL